MFKSLFAPKSIALVGASRTPGKLGYDILSNLKNLGYKGKLYPINPKGKSLLGLKMYADLKSLPEVPDLVLIAIPSPFVNQVLKDCGQKKVKNVVVITAGFKEVGGDGVKREEELKKIVQKYKINLIGPNCLGIINTEVLMNASFAEGMPAHGNVSLISQSGATAVAIIDWAYQSGLGFSKIISMGNKAGLSENHLLEYLGDDPKTEVILMYLESIENGEEFLRLARKISLKKPIIILKTGTSEAGNKAITSHTGALSGSDISVTTAFNQGGIIRVETGEELFDYAKAFSYQSLPKSNKIAIITNAGGPGIMATDAVSKTSLELQKIDSETEKKLATGLPSTAALHNPIDVIGDAPASRYQHALETLLPVQNIDSLIVVLTPQVMTEVKKVAAITTALSHQYPEKTILSSFMGGESIVRGKQIFRRHHFPNYPFPERAIRALDHMYNYTEWKKEEKKRLKLKTKRYKISNKEKLTKILTPQKSGPRNVDFHEVEMLFKSYGIKRPDGYLAKTEKEAVKYADKIGYPVVMKISSPNVYHKTDVGGIRIDLENKKEVQEAFNGIIKSVKNKQPQAKIKGVTVEPMLSFGKEVIIGTRVDPQFGHLLMFGLGGIYVEVLKDVTFRIAPVHFDEALKMVEEIKAIKVLQGIRGEKSVDLKGIADVIMRVSQMVTDFPQIQEFEINPLFVREKRGVVALDAKCIV